MKTNLSKYVSGDGVPLVQLFKEKAESLLKTLELEGKPETKMPIWPVHKAGFISGFISGGDLGFKLAQSLAEQEKKDKEPANDGSPTP